MISPSLIVSTVAEYYKTTFTEIISRNRSKTISYYRYVAMYLCRELSGEPSRVIGAVLGRDASSVHQGWSTIANRVFDDPLLDAQISTIKEILRLKVSPTVG